jgi:hypothetical protein
MKITFHEHVLQTKMDMYILKSQIWFYSEKITNFTQNFKHTIWLTILIHYQNVEVSAIYIRFLFLMLSYFGLGYSCGTQFWKEKTLLPCISKGLIQIGSIVSKKTILIQIFVKLNEKTKKYHHWNNSKRQLKNYKNRGK